MKKITFLVAILLMAISCKSSADNSCAQSCSADVPVKNIIFMIGDGMGLTQASMLMIEEGYKPVSFDRSDNVAMIKTYSNNNRVTDSAAAGTALACGEKTDNKMLGVTPAQDTLTSMIAKANKKGMSTGIVVSCGIQHATPAAFYAHTNDRNDNDKITLDFMASDVNITIGGGATYFEKEVNGKKLIDQLPEKGFTLARNFEELAAAKGDKIVGLFEDGHIKSIADGRGDYLPKATAFALEALSKDNDGFLLMVEGSQIDWACHANNAVNTLEEMQDFDKCISVAMDFADKNPGTLVIVTADHETGGLAATSNEADFTLSDSGINYVYGTGGHSGTLVPVYLYGAGANKINGIMENTELSKKVMDILSL